MMPTLFIGHGSPMNAIEDNEYTQKWQEIAASMPKPEAILAVSAHWFVENTRVLTTQSPRTIHDFYGFPDALHNIQYKALGAPKLAYETKALLGEQVLADDTWGLDHGTWSVLKVMYPEADIPVYQLSIDQGASAEDHFAMGVKLRSLRKKNVLILGSGNVVHNLNLLDFSMSGGYDWAYAFDQFIKNNIEQRTFENVINYHRAGESARHAFYTPDHFYPLLYVLGAVEKDDELKIYNESCMGGSLSMTSYVFSSSL